MSFGDIAPDLPVNPPVPTPPALCELQRLLKPLAANNAALRNTTSSLESEHSLQASELKRARALREQNRQIAQAAAGLVTSIDLQIVAADPDLADKAEASKREFHHHLDDFSEALTDSVVAERHLIAKHAASHTDSASPASQNPRGMSMTTTQVAIEQDAALPRSSTESDPLLAKSRTRTAQEQAILREIQANDKLVQERHTALSEIQASVDDVNSIFNDLAVMVGDQRSQVEYVEVAVGDAAGNVSAATREIEKTQRRREARKRFFFVTLLSIAAIIALFLIFLLS